MKKGTRICAAGLLALTMALGAAPALGVLSPATALAETVVTPGGITVTVGENQFVTITKDGDKNVVSDPHKAEELDGYLSTVDAGTTIVLGEGEFEVSQLGNPCTIKGAGEGKTILKGTLTQNPRFATSATEDLTLSVSDLTMCATAAQQTAIQIKATNLITNVSNVDFQGYLIVTGVQGADKDTEFNFDNVKLTNDYIAVKLDDTVDGTWPASKAGIGKFNVTSDSSYFHAVEYLSSARHAVYPTVEAYENDKAGSDTWNNVNEDTKLELHYYYMNLDAQWGPLWAEHNGYVCVATNGDYKYFDLAQALWNSEVHDTIALQSDATLRTNADVEAGDVTLEGNGHVITVTNDGVINVKGDNLTVQNVTVDGINQVKKTLFNLTSDGNAPIDTYFENVTLDNRGGTSAIAANHANVHISGEFNAVTGVGAEASIVATNTAARKLASVTFAADAKVTHNDQSGKGLPLIKAVPYEDGAALPTVTVADQDALVVSATDVDLNNNGKVDYQNVEVSMKAPEAQDVAMTRLYNPYTGEHFYTGDANEAQVLVTMGWNDEGQAWVAPAESETPVYRLYNPYTDEHHYTTDENEYSELAKIGWKQEGVKFYSAGEDGTPVYRLFNPYATRYTHIYTTDGNEAAELQEQGWSYEGVGFYGVK